MFDYKKKSIYVILTAALVIISSGRTSVSAEQADNSVKQSELQRQTAHRLEAHDESKTIKLNILSSVNSEEVKTEFLSKSTEYLEHYVDRKQFDKDVSNLTLTINYIDFSILEEQVVSVKFNIESTTLLNFKRKIEFTEEFIIVVVSDSVPVVNLTDDSVSLYVNDSFEPNDYIDSFTSSVGLDTNTLQVNSNVDVSTVGDYQVTYSVTNKFGNTGTSTLSVEVKEKPAPKVVSYSAPSEYYTSSSVYEMLNLVNARRASLGIGPLALADSRVMAAADVRASEAYSYVSHYRPNGTYYTTALREQGVSFFASEVLTYSGNTVTDKFNWWMSSSSHRNILLNPNFSYAAFGYYGGMWAGLVY